MLNAVFGYNIDRVFHSLSGNFMLYSLIIKYPTLYSTLEAINHCIRKIVSRSYTITEPGSARLYTQNASEPQTVVNLPST